MENRKVQLVAIPPSGMIRCESDGTLEIAEKFLNQIGEVGFQWDGAYETDRPTGFENISCLVKFDNGKEYWIPEECYCGEDENGKDVWTTFLRTVKEKI